MVTEKKKGRVGKEERLDGERKGSGKLGKETAR